MFSEGKISGLRKLYERGEYQQSNVMVIAGSKAFVLMLFVSVNSRNLTFENMGKVKGGFLLL